MDLKFLEKPTNSLSLYQCTFNVMIQSKSLKQKSIHKVVELSNSLESKNEIERSTNSSNLKAMKPKSLGYSIYTHNGI